MNKKALSGELIPYDGPGSKGLGSFYLKDESFWLTQSQMSNLFDTDVSTIGRHIKNIYDTRELTKKPTQFKTTIEQEERGRTVRRTATLYNLDVIISVGYRVNSKRGTQFRQWATKVLRDRLEASGKTALHDASVASVVKQIGAIALARELESDEVRGLLQVITDYSLALDILDDYDHQRLLPMVSGCSAVEPITYDEAMEIVEAMKTKFPESTVFGLEKDSSLNSSLSSIFQTFGGKDLYSTFYDKAANLLYFLSKNHSFVDGNKRIAAAIFVSFLHKNRMLHDSNGGKRIADATLVALTLMASESSPSERATVLNVIITLLQSSDER